MNQHTDGYANWFTQNVPGVEYFLYLIDESANIAQTQMWANWIATNPGPGRQVKSMATVDLPTAATQCPSLDYPTSTLTVGVPSSWQPPADRYTVDSRKHFWMYNAHRPATGSFATEDDGVAMRELAWAQYKKRINRWFFWESTYFNNYQGGMGETNVFQTAHTFGGGGSNNALLGETGWNYSNGEGILAYPGTDRVYPSDSYGVNGLFASLRMKTWRRGIQDVDYLTMASAINPSAVQALVNTMVPKALWEYGIADPNDPTWVRSDISWSIDPDTWENARAQLAVIIDGGPVSVLPPAAPAGVTVTPQNGSVVIAWNAVTGANSYNVYYKQGTGVTPAIGIPLIQVISPLAITSLINGLTYSFVVTAVNAAGEGSPSTEANATPSANAPVLPGQPTFVNLQPQYPMTSILEVKSDNATSIHFAFSPRSPNGSGALSASAPNRAGTISAASPNGKLTFSSVLRSA